MAFALGNSRLTFILVSFFLSAASVFSSADNTDKPAARMAVVIDDLGHNVSMGRRAINLPVPVTLAFLPERNFTRALASYAHRKGQEIIVHLPMENQADFPLGPLGLTRSVPRSEWPDIVEQALASVPFSVGINNHLGSILTQDQDSMNWLMAYLQPKGLYFLDSMTVTNSVAGHAAEAHNLAWTRRHVFLDNSLEPREIDRQFQRALKQARERGHAVLVAHPHYESLKFLERRLVLARDFEGIEFVPVSQIVNHPEHLLVQR